MVLSLKASSLLALGTFLSRALGYTPATGPTGGVQPRLDVRTLANNADQWNIFLLGMRSFQNTTDDAVDGYYAISGIHGQPFEAWDDQPAVQQRVDTNMGYCWHGSPQFFLWHRPYVSLFEQALVKHALNVAESYQDETLKTRYQQAASTLRLPYWDWAQEANVPAFFSSATVSVTDPATGQSSDITNPLLSYTLRNPSSIPALASGSATSRQGGFESMVSGNWDQRRMATGSLLNAGDPCWNTFAGQGQAGTCQPAQFVSIEGIHNAIHGEIGGDMGQPQTAAFDPIFWLHHCNVDRVGALWQAINFNTFMTSSSSGVSTFAQNPQTVDAETPLIPFRHRDGADDWWTSSRARDVTAFSYTYPELQGSETGQGLAVEVRRRVNALYGEPLASAQLARTSPPANSVSARMVSARSPPKSTCSNLVGAPTIPEMQPYRKLILSGNDKSFSDYLARVHVDGCKASVGYTINLYFGTITPANKIGSMSVFSSMPGMKERRLVSDVPFTNALLQKLISKDITCLTETSVGPYAKKNIKWNVIGNDGKDYTDKIKLRIQVMRNTVIPSMDASCAPKITAGKKPVVDIC